MAGLFGVLDISSRALMVTQRGVSVTGHNIANVNTPGYSRQRQVLVAGSPIANANGALGTGVEQSDVLRITDAFVENQLVLEQASMGSLDAQAKALASIDAILNEQQAEGISGQLSRLYRAFADLANSPDPGASTERAAVRSAAGSLVDTIQSADARLRDLQRATDRSLVSMLPEVNRLAGQIADLNVQIVRESGLSTPNDLLDRRDQLVRELSQKLDVSTFEQGDGSLVVMIANGVPLVNGAIAGRLEERDDTANPFDPTYSRIFYTDGANDLEVTPDIGGGELGGMLRARDTLVANAIRGLDTVAYNLANSVNVQHRAGFQLGGAAGGDFFGQPPGVEDAARDLALAFTDLSEIAAAGQPGGLPSDNENALALAALEYQSAPTYAIGAPLPPAAGTGPVATTLELAASMLADIGHEARSAETSRDLQGRIVEGLQNRRDEVSGVSIDEEVTNLVRLQATFQANARVIATVNRLLEDVVSLL